MPYALKRDRLAANARSRKKHPEAGRRASLKYREAHRNQERLRKRRQYAADREAHYARNARRRARERLAPGHGISADEFRVVMSSTAGLCSYCGTRAKLVMDHIDPLRHGGAHDPGNVAPACASCNRSKKDKSLLVWLAQRKASGC